MGLRVMAVGGVAPGSHKAWAINTVKTSGGFERLGHRVRMACRRPEAGWTIERAAEAYNEPNLEWAVCPFEHQSDDLLGDASFLDAYGAWAAEEAVRFGADLVYARHFTGAAACARAGIPTVMESHGDLTERPRGADECIELLRSGRLRAFCTIAKPLVEIWARAGVPVERISIVEDGVDLELFARPRAFARAPVHAMRTDTFNVLYSGHLYDYKGIPTILEAASGRSSEKAARPVAFHLLGGTDEDVGRVRADVSRRGLLNVHVHGRVEHAKVPPWLWHADALLLPPSARHRSAAWTSPVKLGEYLASGRPVICSDIPALRALVDERCVDFFAADDAASLRGAIERVRGAASEREQARCESATERAERWSYARRAERMLEAAGASGERARLARSSAA